MQLKSLKKDPSRLVVAKNQNNKTQGWIIGDEVVINLHAEVTDDSLFGFIISLLACYYAYDLS